MNPEGWLIEPNSKWLLLFYKDPTSIDQIPEFYMEKWEVSAAKTPLKLVNRRKVGIGPALETWSELVENGWVKINAQFGEVA